MPRKSVRRQTMGRTTRLLVCSPEHVASTNHMKFPIQPLGFLSGFQKDMKIHRPHASPRTPQGLSVLLSIIIIIYYHYYYDSYHDHDHDHCMTLHVL